MRKFLLLTAMLVASVCAMAQSLTVYYVNDQGWDVVNAYAWSPEPNSNWPGSPATLTSETCNGFTVYSFDVDYSKTTKIIFNNGAGQQTGDLNIVTDKPYFYQDIAFASITEIEGAGEIVKVIDLYIRGDVSGAWGVKDEFKFTTNDQENYVLEFAEPTALTGAFKVAPSNWNDADYIYGGAEAGVTVGLGSTTLSQGNGSSDLTFAAGLVATKIEFNRSTATLKITGETSEEGGEGEGEGGDDIVPTSEYYMAGAPVEGTDWVCGENWNPAGCPLENGTKEFANLPAGEYKFKITNGAWPNAEGTGGSCWGFADLANAEGLTEDADANVVITLAEPSNVSVSFDGTLITVVITPAQATDLEDVDAEDAVVAAYDITGKPVAADAKGLVILQYASGKAVKIFN